MGSLLFLWREHPCCAAFQGSQNAINTLSTPNCCRFSTARQHPGECPNSARPRASEALRTCEARKRAEPSRLYGQDTGSGKRYPEFTRWQGTCSRRPRGATHHISPWHPCGAAHKHAQQMSLQCSEAPKGFCAIPSSRHVGAHLQSYPPVFPGQHHE